MSSEQTDGDMHFKMCKKIAQLTKVIYHLNTKTEDNDMRLSDLRERHDMEVAQLRDDANRRVEEVQEAFRAAEQGRSSAVESAQNRYKEGLEKIKAEYLCKVAQVTKDVEACKSRFESTIKEIREKCKADAEGAIAAKCQAKDAETTSLVREYNDRYKTMLAEQMSARDDLEKKLKDAQSQMEADKGSHALELERLEAQRREIEKKSAAELASWKEKFEREALKAEGLLKERDMLNSRVNESTCSIGSYREMEAQLRRKLEELENKLGESENRCQSLNDMLDEKVAEIERKHSALTDMTNQRNLLETKCNDITQERDASLSLASVNEIERPLDVPDKGILCDLLWADPEDEVKGFLESDRGVSYLFGEDIVADFLDMVDMDLVVRAHQVMERGYGFFANRQLVTIFSAPNYCGEFDNDAAVMNVDEKLQCSFLIIPAR
uniref:Uncharacterized protein TCIL3000_9_3470 n=1 Tax=Trypanosoma congolense (strain IL3000) TaxID=1068625 RepID=G0UU86_TRYCI|nr:unnamed protein product [Trypanosoma congolense IL3000]